ncbi:MAG: hypothetical protein ACFFDP_07555 [Promethearchaeota archaeon]
MNFWGLEYIWYFCIIIGSFALTLMADAVRVPKHSSSFFWQHWWHTPLLVYTAIGAYWPFSLITYLGGTIYHILIQEAIATSLAYSLITIIWLHLTRTPTSPQTKDRSKNQMATDITILIGTIVSFTGLFPYILYFLGIKYIFNILPLIAVPLLFYAIPTGLAIYLAGFLLKIQTHYTMTIKSNKPKLTND